MTRAPSIPEENEKMLWPFNLSLKKNTIYNIYLFTQMFLLSIFLMINNIRFWYVKYIYLKIAIRNNIRILKFILYM